LVKPANETTVKSSAKGSIDGSNERFGETPVALPIALTVWIVYTMHFASDDVTHLFLTSRPADRLRCMSVPGSLPADRTMKVSRRGRPLEALRSSIPGWRQHYGAPGSARDVSGAMTQQEIIHKSLTPAKGIPDISRGFPDASFKQPE
jgi:hypothetical protein